MVVSRNCIKWAVMNTANIMNDTINVGMFEHVTKMGRIGGRHNSAHKPKAGPQFKHVPYSDQILMPTTPPRSSVTTPTSESNRSKVIYKDPLDGENLHSSFRQSPIDKELSFNGSDKLSDIDIREPISNVAVVAVNNTGKEPPRKKAFGNYEEMKLGRNMRAVPRGGVGGRASAAANKLDTDVSEPLLHIDPNPPGNNVLDYFTNTHPACSRPSITDGSTASCFPARTLTSPQHPSQDLIEMLNRNQLYHTPFDSRHNEPRQQAREQENHDKDQTENVLTAMDKDKTAKDGVESDARVTDNIEIKHEYKTEMEHTRDLEPATKESSMQESSPFAHGRVPNMPIFRSAPAPPPESMLYSREATSSLLATREATEQVPTMELSRQATGPFTPHSGGTSLASTFEVKDERSIVVTAENNKVKRQETTDDIQEIEEQINLEYIATNSDGGKTDSDEFAF